MAHDPSNCPECDGPCERQAATRNTYRKAEIRDKWDSLFEDGEDYRALMGSEDVAPGLEKGDGFYIERVVRATEPWHVSEVQLGERPRVQLSIITKKCAHCGETYKARRSTSTYCGTKCRVAAHRA